MFKLRVPGRVTVGKGLLRSNSKPIKSLPPPRFY